VGIANYNIFRDGGSTPIAVVGGTGFTDTGLNPSTTYTYRVSAVDTSNNESPKSSPVQGTTASNNNGNGGNQGGGGNQDGNQGGNSQGGGSSKPPNAPPPINLDNLPPVTTAGVCSGVNSATAGQIFSFTSTDGAQHKITILQVGADSIVVKIDSLPKTLFVGQLISQDITGDGTADICLDVLSITNGVVKLDIARIIFAIAPGGGTTNNGFGAGSGNNGNTTTKAAPSFLTNVLHHIPKALLLAFPWLLFILLGSSVARLVSLSIQERRYAAKINAQLQREKTLSEQRNNFVSLASHYLRTPITTISTGIELAAGLNPEVSSKESLMTLSSALNQGVNDLLAQAEHRAPSEIKPLEAGSVVQHSVGGLVTPAPASAGGYIQLNSLQAITFTTLAAFGLVGLADYILTHVDLYNVGLIHILTQLAALGLLAVMLVASLRSYHNRRDLRLQAERQLASQRELTMARSTLIKNSLDSLRGPLKELKAKLAAAASVPGANPAALKPALDGIAQLEGLLSKFVIASSLEANTIGKNARSLDINQLAGSAIQRYTTAIQGKYLAVKNEVSPTVITQDQLLLSFVIDSLLNNAIKYSPNSSEITIDGKRRGNSVELSVHDNGPGIPQSKQPELFAPFSRAENAAQSFNTQGAGLSLYLDKLVMEYLGGDINLQSTGSGTTVSLSIPA
jgi:signal transduction histidine kinase